MSLDPNAPRLMRLLADWFDKLDDQSGNVRREVQADLRRWADQWESLLDASIAAAHQAADICREEP